MIVTITLTSDQGDDLSKVYEHTDCEGAVREFLREFYENVSNREFKPAEEQP